MSLVEGVGELLRADGVSLAQSQFIQPDGAADRASLLAIAVRYAVTLSQPPSQLLEAKEWGYGSPLWIPAIMAALVELQNGDLVPPSPSAGNEPGGVTIVCRIEHRGHTVAAAAATAGAVAAVAAKETVSTTHASTESGAAVRAAMAAKIGLADPAGVLIIARGRQLDDGLSLGEQGWHADATRKGRPLKALLIARPPDPEAGAGMREDPVATICTAAARLTRDGYGDFELADARTGRLVPIAVEARTSLIAAIALHAKGREVLGMATAGEGAATAVDALPFLSEADAAYDRCRASGAGELLNKLDNYGHLQLDLCWVYALVGDPDYLPDAERRLAIAERVLVSKLDPGFLSMAEMHATTGGTLPPTVVQMARFWLLRGLARHVRAPGDAVATRDLDRAALFVRRLRVNPAAAATLVAMGATQRQAVAALRRAEGVPDKAAAMWLEDSQQKRAAGKRRAQQQKYGTTADGSFVEIETLDQLASMGFGKQLVVAALKQCNNDMEKTLVALSTQSAESLLGPSKARALRGAGVRVDDVALASLLSMGFERGTAEAALKACDNDVERAVMHATVPPDENAAGAADGDDGSDNGDAADDDDDANMDDETKDRRAADRLAYDEARDTIEREMGQSLRRSDLDDDIAGQELHDEEALLRNVGYPVDQW